MDTAVSRLLIGRFSNFQLKLDSIALYAKLANINNIELILDIHFASYQQHELNHAME